MHLESPNIIVQLDSANGNTTGIYNPYDPFCMNWILSNTRWGITEDFDFLSVDIQQNGICTVWENNEKQLKLTVMKKIHENRYQESYCLSNLSDQNILINRDSFGLCFPYDCVFENKKDILNTSCITHVWCGGDVTWLYSSKPIGMPPSLICYCTKGSFSDYSLHYNISRVRSGCNYRGDIVLHPTEQNLSSGESLLFQLEYLFAEQTPDIAPVGTYCDMRLSAERYSAFIHEKINCSFESVQDLTGLEILVNGKYTDYSVTGNRAVWTISSDQAEEIKVCARLDGKQTWMHLNILEPLPDILQKRAAFIVQKQQYHNPGSTLDGAYLIYDRADDTLVYSDSFGDHNACRERLSYGTIVTLALQYHYNPVMMESLIKHRAFVEREVFDVENAIVFNETGRNNRAHRAYNYPWMADYYLEWYNLSGEQQCIVNAARIMISYYDNANGIKQVSPCMRITDICEGLDKENLPALKKELLLKICAHADLIVEQGNYCFSHEVSCTQGLFLGKIDLLCQTYLLTGKEQYRDMAAYFLTKSDSFSARQPDFHVHDIAVRYWDLYWFGKMKIYGDTMPQWLSAWAGQVYTLMYKSGFGDAFRQRAEQNLTNNLCVFQADGFGAASYLMPYKVVQYSSDPNYHNDHITEKTVYGHVYDDYANDQDWALYFAVKESGCT